MNFVTIDVETANANIGSICQIGMARFNNGVIADEWVSLIDPEDYFEEINISVHGIESHMVRGSPKLSEVAEQVDNYLRGSISVCHTHFDRRAIGSAFTKYALPPIATTWLDSASVARRHWPECSQRGYGLSPLCKRIGYDFKHHDALEDAKAAGHVLLSVLRESNQNLDYWLRRVGQPIDPTRAGQGQAIERDGNPEGDFFGEVLVFTGELEIPRNMAADLAARAGFTVGQGVTKKTTMLVVGSQDATKLKGREKSSKHIKAEELSKKGQFIRIVREEDFVAMTNSR